MTETMTTTHRQPVDLRIDLMNMRLSFSLISPEGDFRQIFSLPIKVFGSMIGCSVAVDEDDIKKLCLEEDHSLADFEAIRLGIKAFLRDYETYMVNDVAYRVRREDILCEIVKRVIKGERVPKAEAAPESEAA